MLTTINMIGFSLKETIVHIDKTKY